MTEAKVTTTTAKAGRPAGRTRQALDPPFRVVPDRPEKIITAMSLNNSGRRQQKPLTAAVLATLGKRESVEVPYSREEHARLLGRFKGIEARRGEELRFKYSFIMKNEQETPSAVRYWCEPAPKPALVPPPAPPATQPVVGHDVE